MCGTAEVIEGIDTTLVYNNYVFLFSEPGTYKLMWFDSFLQVWEGDRLAKCINVADLKKNTRK